MAENPYALDAKLRGVPYSLNGVNHLYVFRTKIDGARGTILGHVDGLKANGTLVAGAVVGANAPKPARATKFVSDAVGYESSYISSANILQARTDGWSIISAKFRRPGRSARTTPVYVEITIGDVQVRYGWMMPTYQKTAFGGEFTQLGITEIPATTDPVTRAFFGINAPRPGRATKPITGGKASTFVGTAQADTARGAGWAVSEPPLVINGIQVQ